MPRHSHVPSAKAAPAGPAADPEARDKAWEDAKTAAGRLHGQEQGGPARLFRERRAHAVAAHPRIDDERVPSAVRAAGSRLHGSEETATATRGYRLPLGRAQYEADLHDLRRLEDATRERGGSSEQVARLLHQAGREIGVRYAELIPSDRLAALAARNDERYGDPLGPGIDHLRAKGKSWEEIIESAKTSGAALAAHLAT